MWKPDSGLGTFVGRLWGLCHLAALAVTGLVGWFVIAAAPILGLLVLGGLLFGWVWVKSMGMVGKLPVWPAGSRSRPGIALPEP